MTPRNPLLTRLLAGTVAAGSLALAVRAELIHRYNFNETGGTVVQDLAGDADGILKGTGGYFGGDGRLYLPGGGTSGADEATVSGYVDLPNHIINVLTDLSIESWVTWDASGSAWQRVFDLGTSAGGENVVNGNGTYLFLSPQGDANLRFAVRDIATGAEPTQLTAGAPLAPGEAVCLTVTYSYTENVARLYSNAVLLATGPAAVDLKTINDVNNWLGRSQWNDNMFQGSYDEFRIHDRALDPVEVAASFVSGANTPSTDVTKLGTLQSVTLTVPKTTMVESDEQPVWGTADFANLQGIRLAGVAGATVVSDNPAVLTVDATGTAKALKPGVAKLTLSYLGKTDDETVYVNQRQTGIAVAGTLAADLRASDTANDASTWKNRAVADGSGDFLAAGTPTYVANVENTGVAGVRFNPVSPSTDAYTGPITTAELHGSSDRSIEVWAYNPAIADEETLVAFSRRGGPDGTNLSFNYGANGAYGAVGHWGSPDMGWAGTPAAGQWHYLVYAYDGIGTAKVYADGLPKYSETFAAPLNTHPDLSIRIAAQANTAGTDFDFGQALSGYIAMVRVHTGKLTDKDVANNFLYGPTLQPPGELQAVKLAITPATLPGPRTIGQARVTADFANLKNVNVIGFSTLVSSDPSVLTVAADGVYTAVQPGSATLTATYLGRPASQTITVTATPAMALKHRYSFSEGTAATVAVDSAGDADGLLKGNGGAFDGNGRLVLPGGSGSAATPDAIAGYVDLPNGIISSLVNPTFEAWVTWEGSGSWQRIFDLGTSAGGEDNSNGNGAYLFLSPQGDANLRFAVRDPRTGGEPTQLTSSARLAPATEVYIAAVYDYTQNQSRLYSNAVQVASGPANVPLSLINDVNNWLGRSQWNDNMFQGSFNEFRIWEGALSADQVAANFAAGPTTVPELPVEAPMLGIARAGGSVIISWPANATGFVLQSTASLAGTSAWGTVDTSGAIVEGGLKKLTVSPASATQFYRMRK